MSVFVMCVFVCLYVCVSVCVCVCVCVCLCVCVRVVLLDSVIGVPDAEFRSSFLF